MSVDQNTGKYQARSETTQNAAESFDRLGTDEKLALLYFAYKEMGKSITPAAPTATDPELAPKLLGDYFQLDSDRQLAIMREIVSREDTEYSRAYGILKENNQLMVWFAWAQAMGDTVIDIPQNYELAEAGSDLLNQLKGLEFEEQITIFRTIASNMGYTDVKPIPTQAETGKTASL